VRNKNNNATAVKLNQRGDWYLLRAKFRNHSNFFVREVGRGSGVLESNPEIAEVLRGGGRRWWRPEAGLYIFWKKVRQNLDLYRIECSSIQCKFLVPNSWTSFSNITHALPWPPLLLLKDHGASSELSRVLLDQGCTVSLAWQHSTGTCGHCTWRSLQAQLVVL